MGVTKWSLQSTLGAVKKMEKKHPSNLLPIFYSCVPADLCQTEKFIKKNDGIQFALAEQSICDDTSGFPADKVCCHKDNIKENPCDDHNNIGYR